MAHEVFISYSSKDKSTADAVCAVLEFNGIRCWIAPRDAMAGHSWSESIVNAIKGARVMVLVFSAHVNYSTHIAREVERAVSRGVPIIPFRIEEVKPSSSLEYFISTSHWLDAFTLPIEQHLQHLTQVVLQILGRVTAEPESPSPQLPLEVRPDKADARPNQSAGSRILRSAVSNAWKYAVAVLVVWAFAAWLHHQLLQAGLLPRILPVEPDQPPAPAPQANTDPHATAIHNAVLIPNAESTIASDKNWVKIISTTPASPAQLKEGQIMGVTIQYAAKDSAKIWLNAYPYYRGRDLPFRPGQDYLQVSGDGQGIGQAFFSCLGGADIDQVKVTMQENGTGRLLAQSFASVEAHWSKLANAPLAVPSVPENLVPTGNNWVRVISTSPASPSLLQRGQIIMVLMQYPAEKSGSITIDVEPLTQGMYSGGRPGTTSYIGPGVVQSSFSVAPGKDVDQLSITLHDSKTRQILDEEYVPVDFHWR